MPGRAEDLIRTKHPRRVLLNLIRRFYLHLQTGTKICHCMKRIKEVRFREQNIAFKYKLSIALLSKFLHENRIHRFEEQRDGNLPFKSGLSQIKWSNRQ